MTLKTNELEAPSTDLICQETGKYMEELDKFNGLQLKWLSYYAFGFSVKESCKLAGVKPSTIDVWSRKNKDFAALIENRAEFRRKYDKALTRMEFMRNFRLCLQKDYNVLSKPEAHLGKEDHAYLNQIRKQYSPQQLHILETLEIGESTGGNSFTQLVMNFIKNA